MPTYFCLTIRFLQPYSHGRTSSNEPEWPPSPLRLFQALVAASAARWNERLRLEYAVPALQWLEQQLPPKVIASQGSPAKSKYRLYVPDNVGDTVARSWSRGGDESIAKSRTEKDVQSLYLKGEALHYLYPLAESDTEFEKHREMLSSAARSITHLGWGVDMVAGNATVLNEKQAVELEGEVWKPVAEPAEHALRVPVKGTLQALVEKHEAFLNRISEDGFKPVPPLSRFEIQNYRRDGAPVSKPWVAFQILQPDASGYRTFDTARRTRDVAAWVRHATSEVCQNWPFEKMGAFVHGHTEAGLQVRGEGAEQRFMYLPLPTINSKLGRVESIRRVLIAAPAGFNNRVDWIRRRLSGMELVWNGETVGMLNLIVEPDGVTRQYTGKSKCWSTVTPIILPGYDDQNRQKAGKLVLKAFRQAGLSESIIQGIVDLDWRAVGFRAGAEMASRYLRSENLNGPVYHVRVEFTEEIQGPLAIGAGRFRGLGLFAAES